MQPPIPEPATPQVIERGPRPRELRYLLAVEIVLLALWEFASAKNSAASENSFSILLTVGWCSALWYLWKGQNWARRVVMFFGVVIFVLAWSIESIPIVIGLVDKQAATDAMKEMAVHESTLERVTWAAYGLWGLIWFFRLQTREMKAFFQKPQSEI